MIIEDGVGCDNCGGELVMPETPEELAELMADWIAVQPPDHDTMHFCCVDCLVEAFLATLTEEP